MPNEHESTFHDYLQQGDLLRDEGQLAEAESAYQAAVAIDPANINAHYKLFDLYLRMGRESEAMHELDRLPEKKWDFSQACVPESEPEVQYEEAHYAQEESPTAQPLASEPDSFSSIQEPLSAHATDTTPHLERPPQAFLEDTLPQDAWVQPEVLESEKPPQAVHEQERQRDQVEMGETWEIDQLTPSVSAAEISHNASEQNVASTQTPAEEQRGSGHSLFDLPEDDTEYESDEFDERDERDERDGHDEYDDIAPVLPEDRPQRPWSYWLAGLGVLGTLLYAAWLFFFVAPSPAPSYPSHPSYSAPPLPSALDTQENVKRGIPGQSITNDSSTEDSPPDETLPASPSSEHIVSFTPGMYQVVRDTRLFEKPSEKSLPLAWLPQGIKVHVVEVVAGRWLKIEPRNPNRPSGFLRHFDVSTLKQ